MGRNIGQSADGPLLLRNPDVNIFYTEERGQLLW